MIFRTLAVLALAATLPFLQSRIDERLGTFRSQEEALYLWQGQHVKRLFPGFEALAADVYWLRTVQYFGGQRVFTTTKSFSLLHPLIDITTTLDPRLEIAYRYGAIFLSEGPPMGAGRPEEGLAILEKGARALPESWRLRQDLGFFRYLYLGDAVGASKILSEAAEIPGAAFWLKAMAADILTEGGDRQNARRMWQQMYEQGEEGVIKANAASRLRILDALDLRDALSARVALYERQRGAKPARLADLVAAGLWAGPLADSTGVPFEYDPVEGRVRVSPQSSLWRPEKVGRKP